MVTDSVRSFLRSLACMLASFTAMGRPARQRCENALSASTTLTTRAKSFVAWPGSNRELQVLGSRDVVGERKVHHKQ
jgi:hypothetical protein